MSGSERAQPPRRKRYGQNFLTDPNIIRRIVSALHPVPSDHLLEIGPGRGALTDLLVQSGARLEVVEIDRDLAQLLRERYAQDGVTIHEGDVLDLRFEALSAGTPIRVIGNLPYNISTPLLFHLLEQSAHIRDMHLMVQREVADRLVATPGSGAYGRLGIMASYYCTIEKCFGVPPTAFQPRPRVYSTFLRCTPHAAPANPALDVVRLQAVVSQAFTQRRKVLRNGLKGMVSESELEAIGIDPRARPETLSLAQFVTISDYLVKRDRDPPNGSEGKSG